MSLAAKPLPDFARWGDVEVTPMSNLRKAAAGHLSHAWNAIPHVTQFDQADVTDLEVTRKAFGRRVEAAGGKLTVTAILLKVVAHALRKFPQFNASVDMANHNLILKQYINIGLAVDTPRGLIVPVIRDVDQKNVTELASELTGLSVRAREGKTSIDEMQGGTFTISNLGGIGGTNFTPIVNWPEVAILGVSRGSVQAVHQDGAFVPRTIMPVSLSYDHRIIDGADGARFLRWISEALENPLLLALEG
jgi:pyruvate dehydrogenase E2 component (dihydrolipoamide acetyltransferase)